MNESDLEIQLNLAHIYLLSNDYKKAEKLYKKFENQQLNVSNGTHTEGETWEQMVATDFDFFMKNKIYSGYFSNIKKKLKIK